jgi:hypothetical protein
MTVKDRTTTKPGSSARSEKEERCTNDAAP